MRKDEIESLVTLRESGRLSRREVIGRLAALGLSTHAIGSLLSAIAPLPALAAAPPTRGGSGTLKILHWQGPTILNPHLAQGTNDFDAARFCLEPLLTVNTAGEFIPVLAEEVPTRANGGVAADGRSVTYKLKRGIRWADGQSFTAGDVVFTFKFITHKDTGAITYRTVQDVERVEALGPYTVKITFTHPTPAWFAPFVGEIGQILPRHTLDAYIGGNARNAPFNLKAFGTGPYRVDVFRPGDLVVYSINEFYREPTKPAFDQVQLKSGGDASSAARAVFETGEYDYGWNMAVEWPVLEHMAQGGKGVLITERGFGIEQILCNMTDPNKEVDGQRSSLRAPHPFLTNVKVRQALGMAIDRETIAKQLYGLEGEATSNLVTIPTRLNSKNTRIVFDIAKANQFLDEAGWQRGPDGIRAKGGVQLQITYVATTNTLRQKEQQIVKDGWTKIGVSTTLKSVDAAVLYSSAPGNPQTYFHFYNDLVTLAWPATSPFPAGDMGRFYSGNPARDIPQKENNWTGLNFCRWVNKEYNALYDRALVELDPQKNDELWIKMNDLVVREAVALPLIDRMIVSARSRTLEVGANLTPFDAEYWNIADWRRTP